MKFWNSKAWASKFWAAKFWRGPSAGVTPTPTIRFYLCDLDAFVPGGAPGARDQFTPGAGDINQFNPGAGALDATGCGP